MSAKRTSPQPETARAVAFQALRRIEQQGAFANLVLDGVLTRSQLDEQDRRFATQLVYGTTRMRRACDHLVDRFVVRSVDDQIRTLLRLGAYQLHYLSTPDHAAVSETVELAPRKARGFVNAVLRKVASQSAVAWPNAATEHSYPDWIVELLSADIGAETAQAALEHMNREPSVHERSDGYIQDPASQWVCDIVGAQAGDTILDCCAAPGGKATLLAASGATVVASDRRFSRARLVARNVVRTGADGVSVVVADATALPLRPATFDRVLVDAPCSGLGVLRRRADARWRIDADGIGRLSRLQKEILGASTNQVAVGGTLVYSVCTVTTAETIEIAATVGDDFEPIDIDLGTGRWRRHGDHGVMVLPQDHDTDAMSAFAWKRIR